ncbi:MAG: DUF3261 domain-containing protein [Myxococcota bacterium]
MFLTVPCHRLTRLTAALLVAVAAGACSIPRLYALPRLPSCPGPIPSTGTLPPGDLVWYDRVRYRGGAVDAGFSLVAEKRGERLVLVGLNAFGARAFSVTQERERIAADARLGRALEVPPENVLRDWHAARAALAAAPPAALAAAPGTLELTRPECGYRATFVAVTCRSLGEPE